MRPRDRIDKCYYCRNEIIDDSWLYSIQFSSFVHRRCLNRAIASHPRHPAVRIMMAEFGFRKSVVK